MEGRPTFCPLFLRGATPGLRATLRRPSQQSLLRRLTFGPNQASLRYHERFALHREACEEDQNRECPRHCKHHDSAQRQLTAFSIIRDKRTLSFPICQNPSSSLRALRGCSCAAAPLLRFQSSLKNRWHLQSHLPLETELVPKFPVTQLHGGTPFRPHHEGGTLRSSMPHGPSSTGHSFSPSRSYLHAASSLPAMPSFSMTQLSVRADISCPTMLKNLWNTASAGNDSMRQSLTTAVEMQRCNFSTHSNAHSVLVPGIHSNPPRVPCYANVNPLTILRYDSRRLNCTRAKRTQVRKRRYRNHLAGRVPQQKK